MLQMNKRIEDGICVAIQGELKVIGHNMERSNNLNWMQQNTF